MEAIVGGLTGAFTNKHESGQKAADKGQKVGSRIGTVSQRVGRQRK